MKLYDLGLVVIVVPIVFAAVLLLIAAAGAPRGSAGIEAEAAMTMVQP